MDLYKIHYSNNALEDLFEIYKYIAFEENEPSNAKNLINDIREKIRGLHYFPNRYALVEWSPWKDIGARRINVKNYLIIYLVDENNKTVNIIRIFSSRRDIQSIALID